MKFCLQTKMEPSLNIFSTCIIFYSYIIGFHGEEYVILFGTMSHVRQNCALFDKSMTLCIIDSRPTQPCLKMAATADVRPFLKMSSTADEQCRPDTDCLQNLK